MSITTDRDATTAVKRYNLFALTRATGPIPEWAASGQNMPFFFAKTCRAAGATALGKSVCLVFAEEPKACHVSRIPTKISK